MLHCHIQYHYFKWNKIYKIYQMNCMALYGSKLHAIVKLSNKILFPTDVHIPQEDMVSKTNYLIIKLITSPLFTCHGSFLFCTWIPVLYATAITFNNSFVNTLILSVRSPTNYPLPLHSVWFIKCFKPTLKKKFSLHSTMSIDIQ